MTVDSVTTWVARDESGDNTLRQFIDSLRDSDSYPNNLVFLRNYDYQLKDCATQLNSNQNSLFGDSSSVDFWECHEDQTGFHETTVRDTLDLSGLGIYHSSYRSDPVCRFVFISAPNSRDKLNIDRQILSRILTWHQAMPEFVDFLLAFGVSEHAKDFHYSGFHSDMNLDLDPNRLLLPELGRSGRELRMCHLLRSVEPIPPRTKSQQEWPWSLRPTATYHSFDIETQKSVWIIVKANKRINGRVKAACKAQDLYQTCADNINNPFESTLHTHLVLCAWAGEHWRWYINFIEERVQKLTRPALTDSMADGQCHEIRFSFQHLQDVHYVEEKVNETVLVLRANAAVIREIRDFYSEANKALEVSSQCIKPSPSTFTLFQHHLDVTVKGLVMQQERAKMLLQLLADRKALIQSMLQWENARVSSDVARKAQESAENMETMTEAMKRVADETKMEAANMRIITLVTLFFLPGTFVSTLMSTPIVHYPNDEADQRTINWDALDMFLVIALPLLAVTILTWYALYYWHRARKTAEGSRSRLQRYISKLTFNKTPDVDSCCKA